MALDIGSLITGVSGAGAVVVAAWLTRTGNRNSRRQENENSNPGVSLTKRFMDGQQKELDYYRRRCHQLEEENERLRAERDL